LKADFSKDPLRNFAKFRSDFFEEID